MARKRHTPDGLTERQRAFVEARAKGATGLDAARAAGYAGTPSSLASTASHLLRNESIRAALRARGVPAGTRARPKSPTPPTPAPSPPSPAPSGSKKRRRRTITPTQTLALDALLSGASHADAGKAAGVSRETVTRWYANEVFRSELEDQRLQLLERTRRKLETAAYAAAETLGEVAQGKGTKEQLAAAKATLDLLGLGRTGYDPAMLRERMREETRAEVAASIAEALKGALPAEVYRQVVEALRGMTGGTPS